ncbi:MAG: hypothetical protein A4E52_01330 [Pelotomaculum sp. PtaB.Bin013]|nr:MAG: hypothetical protein A4E52_01330 [Pelotomaculum sp. PtaB.Bin013]
MKREVNPGVAAVLNFFFPGVGYIYLGIFGKALIHLLIGCFVLYEILIKTTSLPLPYLVIGFLNLAISTYNGYFDAQQINSAKNIANDTLADNKSDTNFKDIFPKQGNPLRWFLLIPAFFFGLYLVFKLFM